MKNKKNITICTGIGLNMFFPEMVTIEFEPKKEKKSRDKFDYTILSYCIDDGQTEPHGVMIQIDNGDTQYLTMSEIKTLNKKRKK